MRLPKQTKPIVRQAEDETEPLRLKVPGLKGETGLGDVIQRITKAAHIKTCGGCQQRAAVLNRWVVFSP